MARSIKKGPYVFERLLKRVRALNESGKKEVIKKWVIGSNGSRWSNKQKY